MSETAQTEAQRANLTDAQWNALTEPQKVEARARFARDRTAATPESIAARQRAVEAQRAGMTDAQWTALTDEQRAEARTRFLPVRLTDAQRAGLTASQWDALSNNERMLYRQRFPDTTPPAPVVSVPSPPDPNNLRPMLSEAIGMADHPHLAATSVEAADSDSFENLPNTPGGRNNPSLSYYDPSRPDTD